MDFPTFAPSGPTAGRWRAATTGLLALAFAAFALPASAQDTGTITGMVSDATTGGGLNSVQVYVEGTGLGTLTNQGGRFIILNVPAGAYTLTAERIGYTMSSQDVTVSAGGTAEVNFTMGAEALGLDEIVVTGTAGAARRREVGNSIAQLDLTEVPEPPVSVDGLLQARVPGMTVMQSTSNAGGGARIRLRGNVSVAQSNQPLVYVDGIRIRGDAFHKNVPATGYPGRSGNDVSSPLNDINPNDIERIEVIKGAAATTLYGTEAAAGVIQIFTKRGHQGTARWTAQVDMGAAYVGSFGPDPSTRPPSEPEASSSGGTSDFLFINPWLRTGFQQKYSLSVGGGSEALQYFVSGSFEKREMPLPNDFLDKGVIRGNFTFSPTSNLQFNWNTSYTGTAISNTAAGNNAHGLTLNSFRRDANYLADESFDAIDPFRNQAITTDLDHLVTGITATHTPSSTFTHRLTLGYDQAHQNNRNLRPFGFIRAPLGILNDGRSRFTTLTADYVGSLNFPLGGNLRSTFSFGGQSVTSDVQQTVAYGEDFPGPGEPTVSAAGTRLGFELREKVVNAGLFGQFLLDLSNKYFLTLGLRVDGNSAFGEDLGLQAYPKLSFSWVVSDESFWGESLGTAKIRAAWGQSGRAPGAFDAVRTFDPVGWGTSPAFYPRNLGNDQLGPERTSEVEVGFESAHFDNRLTLDFTYYNQNTTDALFSVRQPPSNGFVDVNGSTSQLENVGEIKNQGIELGINATLIQTDRWQWDLGGSVFTNDSEVGLPGEIPEFSVGDNAWIIDGQPVPVMRPDRCITNPNALAEPIIVNQGSSEAAALDDCVIGPNQPTKIFGINTSLVMPGNVLLTARGEFQGGHYIYNGAAWNAVSRSVIWPGCYDFYNTVETQGRDAAVASERARCDTALSENDFFNYKADFFKIREVTLSVPFADRYTFTVSGHNVLRFLNTDNFPTFEPEMGNNNDNNAISRDGASSNAFLVSSISEHVPPATTWTFSIRATF
jgi:TonB-dependent SusC/RagA subfamily outer membrane receptor